MRTDVLVEKVADISQPQYINIWVQNYSLFVYDTILIYRGKADLSGIVIVKFIQQLIIPPPIRLLRQIFRVPSVPWSARLDTCYLCRYRGLAATRGVLQQPYDG